MERIKTWSLRVGMEQNRVADASLAIRMQTNPREYQRIAARVRQAAVSLLKLAYMNTGSGRRLQTDAMPILNNVLSYSAHPSHWLHVTPPSRTIRLKSGEVHQVQEVARESLGKLILAYPPEDAELSFSRCWRLPPFEARLRYMRAGSYLLHDIEQIKPRWMKYAVAIGAVLTDAMPWFRFCALCGRLFFKVKRQGVCSLTCKSPYQARRRYTRKGDAGETRGRPKKNYAGPVEAVHTQWLSYKATGAPLRSA